MKTLLCFVAIAAHCASALADPAVKLDCTVVRKINNNGAVAQDVTYGRIALRGIDVAEGARVKCTATRAETREMPWFGKVVLVTVYDTKDVESIK